MNGFTSLMSELLLVSLLAFLISVLVTPMVRRYCQQRQLLDFPIDPRKVHLAPLPRLGGVAIYLAFFLPLCLGFLTYGKVSDLFWQHVDILLGLFVTSTLVFAIGVYDDIRGATVTQKLVVQCGAAVILYMSGLRIHEIAVPFIGAVSPGILGLPLTMLWLVGVTNALNFIDGIDGLACGVGFFSVSTMFIFSLFLHNTMTAFLAAALAGGIFGFTIYNFAPASIFMGDSGSLFIGFTIAAISLQGSQKSSTIVVLLLPIVALGVPIADTILAVLRRVAHGVSPFRADKEHIHHRLLQMGLSTRQVVLVLYGVCCLLGVTALAMTAVNNQVLTVILVILSVMTISGMKMLGYTTDVRHIHELTRKRIQQKKRLIEQQQITNDILGQIEIAANVEILQRLVTHYFEKMDIDVGEIRLWRSFEEHVPLKLPLHAAWYSQRYTKRQLSTEHLWRIILPLNFAQGTFGELHLGRDAEPGVSLLEYSTMAENLKYAIEVSFAQRVSQETYASSRVQEKTPVFNGSP